MAADGKAKHIKTRGYLVGGQHMGHTPPISVMQRPKGGKRNCVFKEDVTFLNLRKRPWEVYIRIGFLSVFCGHENLGFVTLRN